MPFHDTYRFYHPAYPALTLNPTRYFRIISLLGLTLIMTINMMIVLPVAAKTNLPLPRFVSLRSSEVNLRTGPGVRYPVEWVFVRKGIPVEIIAEFDHWRKIRDWIGSEGWVHRSMLSGKRTLVVTGKMRALRENPLEGTRVISYAETGVFGKIEKCKQDWCRVTIAKMTGWLKRSDFWGVYSNEKID